MQKISIRLSIDSFIDSKNWVVLELTNINMQKMRMEVFTEYLMETQCLTITGFSQ